MADGPTSGTKPPPMPFSAALPEEEPRRVYPAPTPASHRCPACAPIGPRFRALDAKRTHREQERAWNRAKKPQAKYARQLRGVADQIDKLVKGIPPDDPTKLAALENVLAKYSEMIEPWAQSVAGAMLADVTRRDEALWNKISEDMSVALRTELRTAPTGDLLRQMLRENVSLITSLPIEAGQRVHELALRRLETSGRANEISDEIMKTGEVTRSRANLIARTEVARVASGLIEVRSKHVGSEGYIWRSSEDSDVRNKDNNPVGSHRLLNGKFIRWDEPPVASTNGVRAHAGQIYNCRCWPDPVIPEDLSTPARSSAPSRTPEPAPEQLPKPIAPAAPRRAPVSRPQPSASWTNTGGASPDLARFREKAQVDLVALGKRTGLENLSGYDLKSGKPLGGDLIEGQSTNFVGFSPELLRHITDPANKIELHHNHPRDSSLSANDLLIQETNFGLSKVYAHGHKGSIYSVEKALPGAAARHKAAGREAYQRLNNTLANIDNTDKGRLQQHAVLTALERVGAVKGYEAVLAPDLEKIIKEHRALFDDLVSLGEAGIAKWDRSSAGQYAARLRKQREES